ncbi:FecCD family ABC transporter permease [Ammonifex thiophilus]|uniref:Iron ABC transporter permease n=1 Tax=Ammonifex thiophilus TaxID=444093 RepID=A0A3D8P8H8_9THEO|nr:iron ABC transporter permease [Ammonifex thiophilus]RDV84801.1 iron ABC transporter permease [Ammonifex thiophilus]
MRRFHWAFFLGFVILVFGVLVASLGWGSVKVPPGKVLAVLLHPGRPGLAEAVVVKIRLPRALGALLGGAALGVSGLLLQVFFRNPIVSPYVLGISSGASLAVGILALSALTAGLSLTPSLLALAAFAGAFVVTAAVAALAPRTRSVVTLLVIGLMFGYLASACTSILLAFAEKERVHGFYLWTFGSFAPMDWGKVTVLAAAGLPLLFSSFLLGKALNAYQGGEEYALSVGLDVRRFRVAVVVLSSALAGLVTAFAGPVAFIGLAVPHLARLVLRTADNRVLIPAVILLGAAVTGLCDLLARQLFCPVELPITAVTSLFGAPLVIGFLLKGKVRM